MLEIFTRSSIKSLLILIILTFLYFLESFDRYLIAVSPIPYIDYSSYEYSVLAGPAFSIVYTVGGLIFALGYSDYLQQDVPSNGRISKFAVLSFSTFIFSFAFGVTALAVSFWQQVIIRIVMGLAQSVITPFSTSLIRDYFPTELIGSAFGFFNVGTYFAFALSLSLGIFIYTNFGWQAGYLLFGIIGIGGSMLLPFLSCFKLEHNPQRASESYKILSPEDLDQSGRGSATDERPSFFLYDQNPQNHNKISFSSFSSNSSNPQLNRTTNPFKNPMHTLVSDVVEEPSGILTSKFDHENSRYVHETQEETNKKKPITASLLFRMKEAITEIACVYWWQNRGIYLLCIATGVRIGAGYIWSSYTGVFFADLFVKEEDSMNCQYSYNNNYHGSYDGNSVCDSDYPYCVSGDCNALNQFPWHNEGMSPGKIESYMSWVPLVGSAAGSLLGGLISDKIGSIYDSDHSSKLFRYIPCAMQASFRFKGSSNGPCGGRHSIRALICGVSTLLSLPLVAISFFLEYPACFLIYIGSGMLGEMYLGQSLAVIADPNIIPPRLLTSSVALFMLIITIIGGNSPLLIPFVEDSLSYSDTTVSFNAQSVYSNTTTTPTTEKFYVENSNADTLQYSVLYSIVGCYALSGILYLIAFIVMLPSKR